ncbi:MAG: TIGR00266 family protein [Candidatus Paceibacterota bacterium]
MRVTYAGQPAYTIAYVTLSLNEEIEVESGALVAMSSGVRVVPTTGGGVAKAAFRKLLGEEKFFLAKYQALVEGAWIALAPKYPGDINTTELQLGKDLMVQTGSFLASSISVQTDVRYTGVAGVATREGVTMLHATGEGTLLICAYGALQKFEIKNESIIVDTGHIVAFSANMGLRIGPLSGIVSSALTGEGLVAELTGPGEVYVQTRSEQSLKSWLFPNREQN